MRARVRTVAAATPGWLAVAILVTALTACDVAVTVSEPTPDAAEYVPIAALRVNGTYLDGDLDVRDTGWRIGLRRADAAGAGGPEAGDEPADTSEVVVGRLLDRDGRVLVEDRTTVGSTGGEGRDGGDIAEPGVFGLHLGIEDPSAVATLEVEAGAHRYVEEADATVGVEIGAVPATLRDPVDVDVTTVGDPEHVRVELHSARVSGRTLAVHGGSLHLDPTRYGRGAAHVVALVTDGLAADLAHAGTEIDVDFEEHLDIRFDRDEGPIRVGADQSYLVLEPIVIHHTAPGETRTEHPSPWTVTFTSDVDGPLDDLDHSPGHPELYVAAAELSPGTHTITVSASGDGMSVEVPVEVHVER